MNFPKYNFTTHACDKNNSMDSYKQKASDTARFLIEKSGKNPKIAIMTGTGLTDIVAFLNVTHAFEYGQVPHFPVSTVQTHLGQLLIGNHGQKEIMAFQGRFHLYEGYSPKEVVFPVRVMQEMGVKVLIVSNASGGLNSSYTAGDIMVITDHVNLTGENPLIGYHEESWGIRFPDMSHAYDRKLLSLAKKIGEDEKFIMQRGVYAGLKGPCLETPAEVRFLRTIGAEAVGFSTVQEVIAAVHGAMRVLGLSIITNVHNPDDPAPSTVEEIIAVAENSAPKLETIIKQVIEGIDERELS
ncbi:MAG: purine-nucleoside phosphorylase [Desulfobacterales bacterium]|nr:purine-nucleoside phosphorylase [Desulfobacterales bacterium]